MIVCGQTEARAQLSSTIIDYHEPFDQGLRDFPQTKLDSEINAPFLLNEHGYPQFFNFMNSMRTISSITEKKIGRNL